MLDRVQSAYRELEHRPVTRRNRAGAWLAILTCPCHVGVAIILTSGTAVGGWLAAQGAWLYAAFTGAFALGLWLLFRRDTTCVQCEAGVREEPS